jgi:hypothetical protein
VLHLLHGSCDPYGGWTAVADLVGLTARSDYLVLLPEGGRIGFNPRGRPERAASC